MKHAASSGGGRPVADPSRPSQRGKILNEDNFSYFTQFRIIFEAVSGERDISSSPLPSAALIDSPRCLRICRLVLTSLHRFINSQLTCASTIRNWSVPGPSGPELQFLRRLLCRRQAGHDRCVSSSAKGLSLSSKAHLLAIAALMLRGRQRSVRPALSSSALLKFLLFHNLLTHRGLPQAIDRAIQLPHEFRDDKPEPPHPS